MGKILVHTKRLWAVYHATNNRLDGFHEHLDATPSGVVTFSTRKQARAFITEKYSYFKRPDLKAEPHGWKYPKAIPVTVKTIGCRP